MKQKNLLGIFGSQPPKSANINENQQSSQSQCKMILAHLKKGNKLTSLEALNLFGCARLASRINDLKNRGFNIHSGRITLPNGKRVAQYSINNLPTNDHINQAKEAKAMERIELGICPICEPSVLMVDTNMSSQCPKCGFRLWRGN